MLLKEDISKLKYCSVIELSQLVYKTSKTLD